MSVLLHADDRIWLEIPQSFPTDRGELAPQWEERVVGDMRTAWKGRLDAQSEVTVRQALRHGLSRVLPEDSVTLQYWPTASVVNAVVHIAVNEFGEGETRVDIPLDDGPFVVPPVSDRFETEYLGAGIESRALSPLDTSPPMVVGTVNYLFQNSRGYVFVGADPTLPEVAGMMLEPLRDVVRSIRVLDDDGRGAWENASVDDEQLLPPAETWDFGAARQGAQR